MTRTELMQLSQSELADVVLAKQSEVDALATHVERLRSALNPSIMDWLVCGMATNGRTKEEKPMAMLKELRAAITHEPTASLAERDAEVARKAYLQALKDYGNNVECPVAQTNASEYANSIDPDRKDNTDE